MVKEKEKPEVVDYIKKENNYFDKAMALHEKLTEKLFQEMKSRLADQEDCLPYKMGVYIYLF